MKASNTVPSLGVSCKSSSFGAIIFGNRSEIEHPSR